MAFDFLKAFAGHPNRVRNHDQLLELAHNRGWEPFDRSIEFYRALVEVFNFHNNDDLTGSSSRQDPRLDPIQDLLGRGAELGCADYDQRTAIHLASAEGHLDVVRYCIAHNVLVNSTDRWGNRPLDDAIRHSLGAVAELLRKHGGQSVVPESQPGAAVGSVAG